MTPVDYRSIELQAFSYGALVVGERLRRCMSAERLAEQVEAVVERA